MMMRHLFFEAYAVYNDRKILPVLVALKNFNSTFSELSKFIYSSIKYFDSNVSFKDFESYLLEGDSLILLDGLDEVLSTDVALLENLICVFQNSYPNCQIVLSSRPISSFVQLSRFVLLEIQPFSKAKALELIDKLEYYDIEGKAKFRADLDHKLYLSHREFASNPLLLTIMLMTYTSFGEIPAKRHIFYSKAYETMSRLHDATKGSYVRQMHTNLSPEDFSIYFAEFCARTYKDEKFEFSKQSFIMYMNKTIDHQNRKYNVKAYDFLLDLVDNLCIMYCEGDSYHFIHRSFQEYFTAVFFSNQMDDKLWEIGEFFENHQNRQFGDCTFDMLYDMIPERMESNEFPLKQEYNSVRELTDELNRKINNRPQSDDWFDSF